MTDPDRRNITDQRYADDAELAVPGGQLAPAHSTPSGSTTSESITAAPTRSVAPSAPGGQWQATALFGQHDQLFGWSPTELLDELIEHRHRQPHAQMTGRLSARSAGHVARHMQRLHVEAHPPKRLPAGLAVLFGERPFPQPCREVHPRRLLT